MTPRRLYRLARRLIQASDREFYLVLDGNSSPVNTVSRDVAETLGWDTTGTLYASVAHGVADKDKILTMLQGAEAVSPLLGFEIWDAFLDSLGDEVYERNGFTFYGPFDFWQSLATLQGAARKEFSNPRLFTEAVEGSRNLLSNTLRAFPKFKPNKFAWIDAGKGGTVYTLEYTYPPKGKANEAEWKRLAEDVGGTLNVTSLWTFRLLNAFISRTPKGTVAYAAYDLHWNVKV